MSESTGWTTPAMLLAQLQKLWDRGDILASLVTGVPVFPMRLALKGPSTTQLTERFDAARNWVTTLAAMPHCRIEQREFRHRVLGANTIPQAVWIDTTDAALALLGKQREAARFMVLIEQARQRQPRLADWLARRPLRALALRAEWTRLLDVVDWMQAHPRPGVYLRQIDIPGVHSKFIEDQRSVLAEWLDLTLPAAAIDPDASGVSGFARRYGLRDKPERIRFRLLDGPQAATDMTLDAASFARLDPAVTRVFITENEVNFLAFPAHRDSMVIFGAGYGFEMLRDAAWLSQRRLHYWGDIDTHGFAILDQLRHQFDQVASLLMDNATLLEFSGYWEQEEKQTLRDLPRLNPQETALYNALRDNKLGDKVRLEQERIGFGWLQRALSMLD